MNSNADFTPDSAAIFACANSLWEACRKAALNDPFLDLSAAYSGWDQLMREVMRIGQKFEMWACEHVDFEDFSEVWPYMLGDQFGTTCLNVLDPTSLDEFDEKDCVRIAIRLNLSLRADSGLPVPIDITAANPIKGAGFPAFRIQTVRTALPDECIEPFTSEDDPFDPKFTAPYFGIYGIEGRNLEHIADRATFASAKSLVEKLAPGIILPKI